MPMVPGYHYELIVRLRDSVCLQCVRTCSWEWGGATDVNAVVKASCVTIDSSLIVSVYYIPMWQMAAEEAASSLCREGGAAIWSKYIPCYYSVYTVNHIHIVSAEGSQLGRT